MRRQQIRLLVLWLSMTGLAFVLLFLKQMGYRGTDVIGTSAGIVQWLGAVTGVTLTGMITTMLLQERKPELKSLPPASPLIFRLSIVLCALYWLVALTLILFWQVGYDSDGNIVTMVAWLNSQLPWLVFLQATVFMLLAFFFNQIRKQSAPDVSPVQPTAR